MALGEAALRGANDTWVLRPPLRCLVPPVGVWAVSPDDTLFAWSEAPGETRVNVTEVATLRTVLELDGAPVVALQWTSPDALRVFRRVGGEVAVHLHAVPDGGEVARCVLEGLGPWPLHVDASEDGRVALVRVAPSVVLTRSGKSARAYVLRDDVVTRYSGDIGRASALSPDGTLIATGGARLRVTTHAGDEVAVRADNADIVAVTWIDRGRLFVVRSIATGVEVATVSVERDEAQPDAARTRLRGTLAWGAPPRLHPDRTRALLLLDHAGARTTLPLRRTVEVLGVAAQQRFGGLSLSLSPTPALPRAAGGGAWWRDDGALQTITLAGDDGAVVRALTEATHVERCARLSLPGQAPHELMGNASPRRSLAVVTWRTLDGGPVDRPLRLGLLPTRQNV